MKQFFFKPLAIIALTTASGLTMAAGPDLTALTASVDFGTTIIAILGVTALVAAVLVSIRASKTVLAMINGR